MTLFVMDFQFQPPKEFDRNGKCSERSKMDFYINLIFSDDKCPLFTRLGGGVRRKGTMSPFLPFFLYQGFPKDKVQKRDADVEEALMITGDSEVTLHSKTYWVNLFNGFAEMTNPISSDLALFLYCMLK